MNWVLNPHVSPPVEDQAVAWEAYSLLSVMLKHTAVLMHSTVFVEANTKRSLNFVALVELLRGSQKDLEG